MYRRSRNIQELRQNRTKLSETDILIIDNHQSIIVNQANNIENSGTRQTILTDLASDRILTDKLHSPIQFNSSTKIDNLKYPSSIERP